MLSLTLKSSATPTEKIAASLALGLQHHQASRLAQAEACYREILELEPQHPDALHLLGVIAQQVGHYDLAIQLIGSAIQRNPLSADDHHNLANTHSLRNDLRAAIESYRRAIALDPNHIDALHSLANVLANQNQMDEAEACFGRVLLLQPHHAQGLYNLGNAKVKQGELPAAIGYYRQALELEPDCPEFHFNLAHALQESGSLAEATDAYRRTLLLAPDDAEAHYNLGILLLQQTQLSAASEAFRRAIRLKPNYPEALSNLAAVLQEQDDFSSASELLHRALALHPDLPEALSNLGGNLWRHGNLTAALESCRRAIVLKPSLAEAHSNLGHILSDQGDLAGALDCYDHALALKPDSLAVATPGTHPWKRGDLLKAFHSSPQNAGAAESATAAYRRALTLKSDSAEILYFVGLAHLLRGDFAAGWQNYEFRWHTRVLRKANRNFPQPLWRGEPLEGARILLHAEQGIGDTLQFARYIPLVAARNASVIFEVQPELLSLFAGIEGASRVIARGNPLPAFELHSPLISLPLAFRTDLATIPANIPYLRVNPATVQKFSQQFQGDRLRVGLVWSGNPQHVRDPQRSLMLAQLQALTEVHGATFYSLQKGPAAAQILDMPLDMNLIDLAPRLTDFADTAAVIANLDLVISVDTAVAHLAGALGKPTWILLTHAPDWRWLLDREDSPWYPTARLFRQPAPGDWSSVIAHAANELRQLAFIPLQAKHSTSREGLIA
jgi:tetratricopeptide (TPR) repeat protein